MDDCFHLDYEYNFLSKHFKANLSRIINISDYYDKFSNNFKKFIENCLKEKEQFSKIQFDIKDNCNNDMAICISKFFEQQVIIFKQFDSMFTKIKNEFVKPLNNFHHELSDNYNRILKKLLDGKTNIQFYKKKLNQSQRNHYYECRKFDKIKRENDNDFANEDVINQNYYVEETFNIYKKKLNEANNYIVKYNSEYEILMNKILELEDNLNSLLKKQFMNLFNIEENCIIRKKDEYPFTIYSSKKDIEKFKNEIKFKNNKGNRIDMQKYISYQDFKSNSLNSINEKTIKNDIDISKKLAFSMAINEGYLYTLNDDEYNNKREFINIEPPKKSNEEIIDIFIEKIFKNDTINNDKIQEIKTIISEDSSMIKSFVLKYYNNCTNKYYHFENENNLKSVANIFNMILNNLNSLMIEEKIQIIIYILLIGERSYYNNIFLCYLLCENNFLKLKEVWKKLINRRFIQRLSFRVKKIIENRINEQISIFSSFKKLMREESLRRSYFEGGNYNLLREENIETRIKTLGYENKIKNYSELTNEEKLIIDSEIDKNIKKTLSEFIEHLLNYNVSISDSINLIVDIGSKFDLSSKLINYYILCINTSSLSVCRNIKNNEINEKINDLIQKRDITIKLRYPCAMKNEKEKKFILIQISKYLKKNELIPLFLIKKSISKKIRYSFYLKYLNSKKNIPIKIRLQIWKSILDIKSISKSIKDKFTEIDFNTPKYRLINQDIKRTHLGEDSEEINKILINILMKVTDLIEKNTNNSIDKNNHEYYQGMNYLSVFIYNLTKSENESIYLLYSILTKTELKSIYNKEMLKLKNFFPIFEKLLKLYLPSISFYLKKNLVKVDYFLTPFVITIFTNVVQNKDKIPLIILKIWDEFLIKGWKSLISSILILIHFHIDDILSKTGDDLLKFLINDLTESSFFNDENYNLWIIEKFDIKKRYLKILEEEVNFENVNE